jgi:hypothetical protein
MRLNKTRFLFTGVVGSKLAQPLIQRKNGLPTNLNLFLPGAKTIWQIFNKMALPRLPPPLRYLAESSFTIIAWPYKYTQALTNVCYITCLYNNELRAPHEWYWA